MQILLLCQRLQKIRKPELADSWLRRDATYISFLELLH